MAKLKIIDPIGAEKLLELNTTFPVPGNEVVLQMDDKSRFAVYGITFNATQISEIKGMMVRYTTQKDIDDWNLMFYWRIESGTPFPKDFIFEDDPKGCYKLKINFLPLVGDAEFPGFGVDYSDARYFTDPVKIEQKQITEKDLVRKKLIAGAPNNELWLILKNGATKIYAVNYNNLENEHLLTGLSFHDFRSRYSQGNPVPPGFFSYDRVMETVIINAATFPTDEYWLEDPTKPITITVDYIDRLPQVDIPVEAVDFGPMFDMDAETIIRIHPEDLAKLPQETDESPIPWMVVNSKETQGGYGYIAPEYIDTVALMAQAAEEQNDIANRLALYGGGVNFKKFGSAPDSFDKDIEDYRQAWVSPSGEFVGGIWKTKSRGYVTFSGPPNKLVPKGIRVYAPAQVAEKSNMQQSDNPFDPTDKFGARIPNGGIMPAPLVVKLNATSNTKFPETEGFFRKTAAFKPRVMVYMRERVKFNGTTHWKDVGEGWGEQVEWELEE